MGHSTPLPFISFTFFFRVVVRCSPSLPLSLSFYFLLGFFLRFSTRKQINKYMYQRAFRFFAFFLVVCFEGFRCYSPLSFPLSTFPLTPHKRYLDFFLEFVPHFCSLLRLRVRARDYLSSLFHVCEWEACLQEERETGVGLKSHTHTHVNHSASARQEGRDDVYSYIYIYIMCVCICELSLLHCCFYC